MSLEIVYSWLVETSIIVSALIIVVLLIRKPVTKMFGPGAAYALWALPLLRLVLPPLNILPEKAGFPVDVVVVENVVLPSMSTVASATLADTTRQLSFEMAPLVLSIWMVGIIGFFALQYVRQRSFKRILMSARRADPEIRELVRALASDIGLKHVPDVNVMESGPMVTGLVRPILVLPQNFTVVFSHRQQQLVLTHELLHIKRNDLWASLAALLFSALQWFNPLIYLARSRFHADQEAACDVQVLDSQTGPEAGHDYASALVIAAASVIPQTPLALSFGPNFKERLMIIAQPRISKQRHVFGRICTALSIALGLAITANYGYAKSDSPQDEGSEEMLRPFDYALPQNTIVPDDDITFRVFEGVGEKMTWYNFIQKGSQNDQPEEDMYLQRRANCITGPQNVDKDGELVLYELEWQGERPNVAKFRSTENDNKPIPADIAVIRSSYCLDSVGLKNHNVHKLMLSKMVEGIYDSGKASFWRGSAAIKFLEHRIEELEAFSDPSQVIKLDENTPKQSINVGTSISSGKGVLTIPIAGEDTITLDDNSEEDLVALYDCGEETKMHLWIWEESRESDNKIARQVMCMPSADFATTSGQIAFLKTIPVNFINANYQFSDLHKFMFNNAINKKILELEEG